MDLFLALLWGTIVVASIICPVVLFIWLFRVGAKTLNSVGKSLGHAVDVNIDVAPELAPLRQAGPLGRSQDILAACATRAQVAQVRACRKQHRLDSAILRWCAYGLVGRSSNLMGIVDGKYPDYDSHNQQDSVSAGELTCRETR